VNLRTVYDWKSDLDDMDRRNLANYPELRDPFFRSTYQACKHASMLFVPGFYNIYSSLCYVADNGIPGDIIECGCFLGGSTLFMLEACSQLGITDKKIIVCDTFDGFPSGEADSTHGKPFHAADFIPDGTNFRRRFDEIIGSHVLASNVVVIEGPVEQTLPITKHISDLSLVRLDTDFYSSTKVELEVLYPALSTAGVLIIDDYGSFDGCRKATDEYFSRAARKPLFFKVDRGTHACVKPAS
jgi:O-methyltransferase